MKSFKDFNIQVEIKSFTGDKIKIDKIQNREIIVKEFKIENSKFEKGNGKCLYLQIQFKDELYVVFTGSAALMQQIEKVPADGFPFKTTIVKENERYQFT
jgi:hypothetical protein